MATLELPFGETLSKAVIDELRALSEEACLTKRGAIYTRKEVVDVLLDFCEYVPSKDLSSVRLLEPSCGDGDFLLEACKRLVASLKERKIPTRQWADLISDSIRAVEIHSQTCVSTRDKLSHLLIKEGVSKNDVEKITSKWVQQGDFLLLELDGYFDIVVGNPPYIRQEKIPKVVLSEYKKRYQALYDRADIYVLFFEKSLNLLVDGGRLGFICANRWIKNKYGGALREKVSHGYNLDVYIDMENVDAFHESVDAYPSITVISKRNSGDTVVVNCNDGLSLSGIASVGQVNPNLIDGVRAVKVSDVMNGRDPWLVDSPGIVNIVRRLESGFLPLERQDASVGIGVATGCDRVYIGDYEELPVESERKIPLVMATDIKPQGIVWGGRGIVNPWLDDGKMAPLSEFPKFKRYLMKNEDVLRNRYTAKKSPSSWYKTIDRIYPSLASKPKLLIPDIKGDASVVYDAGEYYPHHNLYVVTSDVWDLRCLRTILRSSIALMFVAAYCVRMSGGFLRFQAQYLRRICVPPWSTISGSVRRDLMNISGSMSQRDIDEVVFDCYGVQGFERDEIVRFAEKSRVQVMK